MKIRTILSYLLAGTAGLYAGGFQLNEQGARSMAQAGAFAARAYDGSAVYFNPAGLALQKQNSLYLGTTFISPEIDFYGPSNLGLNTKTSMKNQIFTPINVYVKYGLTEDLHVGFGVNNAFGLGTEWDPNWDGRRISIKADLQTFYFTPTVAYAVNDQISIGAGLNIITGGVKLKQEVGGVPVGGAPPIVDMELSGNNIGFNFGVLYKFSEMASFGATYRSGTEIEGTGTATFTPNYAALALPQGDVTGNLALPATAMIGIAMKPMENLEVEADYQFIGWSSYKELKIAFKADNSTSVQPKNYEDTYIFRLGGEYAMGELKLRAGYLFDNSPVQPKYVDPILPDADRHGWNVGFGYQITETMSVDAAYMFLKVKQSTVTNTESAFDGTYNSIANLFALNFGYTF